jgi:hypothetical protein
MGHTLIGHPASVWNKTYTTHMLQTYSTILDDIRGPVHLRAPPCPYNTQDSPFNIPRLTKMIQQLLNGKSHGPSGITYTIIKKMCPPPPHGPTPPLYENLESSLPAYAQQCTCCFSHPLVPQPTQTGSQGPKTKAGPTQLPWHWPG